MYADYLKEKTDDMIVETDKGFATYRYMNDGKSVYIIDIYILPHLRELGAASSIADLIVVGAKAKGCTELIGTVVPSNKNSTDSLKVLLGYGMKLFSSSQDLIVFKKEL